MVGSLTPKSFDGHSYILAAIDYFSKWAKAAVFHEVKKETVIHFIRYGVPCYVISDNGKEFYNKSMDKLHNDFGFKQHNSSMYNVPTNGLAEAFNETLCNFLKKVVGKLKRDWHERVEETLWVYRTTYRTPSQAMPYSPIYGVEFVLPLECQIPSLRIAIQKVLSNEDNARRIRSTTTP